MLASEALNTRPRSVALLAHGVSLYRYFVDVINNGGIAPWDEVWTVNLIAHTVKQDKMFIMDDLRHLWPGYDTWLDRLKTTETPIITSTAYPEFPTSVSFPIKKVVNTIRDDFFRNTCCYAIGYALSIRVKQLWLYGCDFYYRNNDMAEEGGQNAAYLIGLARGYGCTVRIPRESTLLSMDKIQPIGDTGDYARPLYGYVEQPDLTVPDGLPAEKQEGKVINLRKS